MTTRVSSGSAPIAASRRSLPGDGTILLAITVAAALLRLTTLDVQSLWADEGFTATIASASLGDALRQVADTESTPPLFYALEWLWAHVFGDSAFALRALPALLGVATVPAVAAAGAAWHSRRTGLIAAAVTAVSPFMVWYSQEARAYALLALLGALGFWCLARALGSGERRWVVGWAVVSALALATHYFATFTVLPEAAWLLARRRRRDSVLAIGSVAVVLVALLPLAAYQVDHVARPWTGAYTTLDQTLATAQEFFVGHTWTWLIHRPGVLILALLTVLLVAGLARRDATAARRAAVLPASIAAFGLGAPLVISLVGTNYLAPRNVIAVWPLLALLLGLGAGLASRRVVARAAVGGLVVIMAAITIAVAADRDLQRDDWRDLLADVPAATEPRVVTVLDGFNHRRVVQRYLPDTRQVAGTPPAVSEVLVVYRTTSTSEPLVTPPVAGMVRTGFTRIGPVAAERFTAPGPVALPAAPPGSATELLVQDPAPAP